MTIDIGRALRLACCGAILGVAVTAATPARADFFDDARKTFTSDIPHFFQDDIPCAFGGQPTSHTKASCNSANPPVRSSERDRAVQPQPLQPQPLPPIQQQPLDPPSALSPPADQ